MVWGFAFVAQRAGMAHIGPFLYNTLRFTLGSIVIFAVILIRRNNGTEPVPDKAIGKNILREGGLLAGVVIFIGASLQQSGIVETTAGKAGFITGLYVVIVPLMGFIFSRRTPVITWFSAILAATGLYLLSVTKGFTLAPGDGLVLMGSFIWALHVLIIGKYSPKVDSLKLTLTQFIVCALLSLAGFLFFERTTIQDILLAGIPILYGGFMSVGLGFTLQVVAQREAHPSHAAIIFSLETVFAAIGGWIILHEVMTGRMLLGCVLMFTGMILSAVFKPHGNTQRSQNPESS